MALWAYSSGDAASSAPPSLRARSSSSAHLAWPLGAPSTGEIQAMLAAALDAAERFQPAFHFVILGGMPAEDAAAAALFETTGEA